MNWNTDAGAHGVVIAGPDAANHNAAHVNWRDHTAE
jgi:hypothetical protein